MKLFGVIGMPCSGKSYAAKLVSSKIGCNYISTGNIARTLNESPEQWKETEDKDLFPLEEKLRAVLVERIEDFIKQDSTKIILVDGLPRFGEQASWMIDRFWLLHPEIVEVSTGDMSTLWARARSRARDIRDTDELEFSRRLKLAASHMSEVHVVCNKRLIQTHTIMSADDEHIIKTFKKIAKLK